MQKINSYQLKISRGKVELAEPLALGQYEVQLKVVGDVVKTEDSDNQDGSYDRTFVLKATTVEVIK